MGPRIFIVIRVGILAVLLFLLAKPVMMRPDPARPNDWAVFLDTSPSMRVKDPEERLSLIKKAATQLAHKKKNLKFFSFSDDVHEISVDSISDLKVMGQTTNLSLPLQNAFQKNSYRGGVIFSDGRHVTAGDPVLSAAAIGKPLLVVGVGNPSLFKDVMIRNVQSPPFAFKNVPLSVSAVVGVLGYPGKKLTVKLRDGDNVIALQTLEITSSELETNVSFNWTPTQIGVKNLTIEASAFEGEVTQLNNRRQVKIEVGRDRFRVLYICGSPGPEYGFLRYQFKSDPAVELVTFVILRTAANQLNVADDELSLIPFPTQDILIKQMSTFDLIVFEEFSYFELGLMPVLIQSIRKKVEEGGSFLLTGGPVSFGPNSPYSMGGIAEMIPIDVGNRESRMAEQGLKFQVKAPSHPIFKMESNNEKNKSLWSSVAALEDVFLVPKVKEGATVLGSVTSGGREYPALAIWKFGKGRVAALTARTTWRWSMVPIGEESRSDVYQQFWKNMVLWLTHSDDFKSVRLQTDQRDVHVGENFEIRTLVSDDYFKPLSEAEVKVLLIDPKGAQESLPVQFETAGVFKSNVSIKETGAYRIQAWALRNGKKIGEDILSLKIDQNQAEDQDLRPAFSLLGEMAQASNGKFLAISEWTPHMFDEFENESDKKGGRKVLLWNSPLIFLLILSLFAVEWILRKRRGLP